MDMFHKNSSQVPLQQDYTKLQPVITNYDPKKQTVRTELSDFVYSKYKSELNDVPVQTVAGSTLPLVELYRDEEANDYDPFENRKVKHPTSDLDTLVHLLKGSLGSGILAMPLAFKNAGLWFGLVATLIIGIICTYCIHILVKCAHILCKRAQIPSLGFADIAETAFLSGPGNCQKYSRLARLIINVFLCTDLIGCCCVYVVFVSSNLKVLGDHYLGEKHDVRIYMAILYVPLLLINSIRKLKWLTPFSMIANVLIAVGMGITMYYISIGLPDVSERDAVASVFHMPIFFGTVIFALEGIGVVMPLENNMKNPQNFIGCPGILNIGMGFVVILYALIGFLGYLKFGDKTEPSITLNLDTKEWSGQAVQLMIAIAVFLTYSLQFYVPMEIIWNNMKCYFTEKKLIAEYALRMVLVTFTVCVAVAVPNLEPLIGLIGAVCLSTLGLIFPAVIETIVYWDEPSCLDWRLYKNGFLILFGIVGFITGTYVSLGEIFGFA